MEGFKTRARALFSKDGKFETIDLERRALKEDDILIEIKYTGICHSDIHSAYSEWRPATYPIVPGHEIAGVVIAIGSKVKRFKVGDNAGVGCMVNSCMQCSECKNDYQQSCSQCVFTYNSIDYFNENQITYGGYSKHIVVNENFAIKVPKNAPLEYVAPLLCCGITTYSPLVFSNVKKGQKVAIAGFGGLGVMALKYAKHMGANVYVIARNDKKRNIALSMGAKKLYASLNEVDEKFDLIISTIPTNYNVDDYVRLLNPGGELALLGLPPADANWSMNPASLIFLQHRKIYGSIIGGLDLTQEMLDFSLKHKIFPEIEIINANQIDDVYEKLTSGNGDFRYVIDISTIE